MAGRPDAWTADFASGSEAAARALSPVAGFVVAREVSRLSPPRGSLTATPPACTEEEAPAAECPGWEEPAGAELLYADGDDDVYVVTL